jgi:hypothetical protein
MPSRPVTLLIVLFWVAATGWLVYQEIVPRFTAGEPPPYTIDLTDEVGANTVQWIVLQKGAKVGVGSTHIKRQADGTFLFNAEFKIERFKLLAFELPKLKVEADYRVTEEGKLLETKAKLKCEPGIPFEIAFHGQVRDRQMHPKLKVLLGDQDVNPFPPLEPFEVSETGNVLNPMHLVHKISGLSVGRTWKVPLMDPLKAAPEAVRDLVPGKQGVLDFVVALVRDEPLEWLGKEVPCFKIEYSKPGEAPLAATWVRRRDAIVLQQWASFEGVEYAFQRAQE